MALFCDGRRRVGRYWRGIGRKTDRDVEKTEEWKAGETFVAID